MACTPIAILQFDRLHAQPLQQRRRNVRNPKLVPGEVVQICALRKALQEKRDGHLLLAGWQRFDGTPDDGPNPDGQSRVPLRDPGADVSWVTAEQLVGAL